LGNAIIILLIACTVPKNQISEPILLYSHLTTLSKRLKVISQLFRTQFSTLTGVVQAVQPNHIDITLEKTVVNTV